ncbi:MAG: hypothetical protein J5511_04355 [Bacilli bacterium]|nr:hypothetical protein [Bacilli bacterium]
MANLIEKVTKKKFWQLNPYVLVILSFLVVIFIGSFLLVLPFSQKDGHWGNYMDALFSAVSATCVTGLCTYAQGIGNQLTFFGQLILLLMIQIGGLGFVTVLTFFITLFASKLQFRNRYLLSQMVGSTNFADVVKFVRKLILISFISEIAGTLLGLPVFLEVYPDKPLQAIWVSLFTAVSAFNNAGFDLFGGSSLLIQNGIIGTGDAAVSMPQWAYIYMCIYIMLLIVMGGISFLVIIDIFAFKKHTQWRAFTKIVLSTTAVLLAFGFITFLFTDVIFTKGGMDVFQALFQSVTLRTAGFATYNQDNVSLIGKVVSCGLMFIGGSPLSTAGGIKTTTAFMVLLAMYSYFRGKHVIAFKRTYSSNMIVKAMSLVFLGIGTIIIGFIFIASFERNLDVSALGLKTDNEAVIFFEIFSAFGTVGVSTGVTPYISVGSKIVLCFLMFFGRLGPMTFLQIFQANMDKKQTLHYEYVEEDFLIG